MKAICIADLHFGDNNYFGIDLMAKAFRAVVDYACDNGILFIIIAGDLFDQPNPGGLVLDTVAKSLKYAGQQGRSVAIITGNHELDHHGVSVLTHLHEYEKDLWNVTIATKEPHVLETDQGVSFMLMPWGSSLQQANAHLSKSDQPKNILVGHDDIVGASYDSVFRVKKGISPVELQTSPFDMGVFGHLHNPQEIGLWNGRPFFYAGALLQYSFRAADQQRGFVVIDTETLTYERHSLVGGPWPLFLKIHDGDKLPNMEINELVYFDVTIKPEQPMEDIAEKYYQLGAQEVRVRSPTRTQEVKKRTNISMDDSWEVMAQKYATLKTDDPEDYGRAMEVFQYYMTEMQK